MRVRLRGRSSAEIQYFGLFFPSLTRLGPVVGPMPSGFDGIFAILFALILGYSWLFLVFFFVGSHIHVTQTYFYTRCKSKYSQCQLSKDNFEMANVTAKLEAEIHSTARSILTSLNARLPSPILPHGLFFSSVFLFF